MRFIIWRTLCVSEINLQMIWASLSIIPSLLMMFQLQSFGYFLQCCWGFILLSMLGAKTNDTDVHVLLMGQLEDFSNFPTNTGQQSGNIPCSFCLKGCHLFSLISSFLLHRLVS